MVNSSNRQIFPESSFYLFGISLVFIFIQLFTASNYPLFRDELYYIDCANHISFGYVDHPPVSIIVLALWKSVFGDSLFSLRVLPALSGGLLIFLSGYITASLGGNKSAQILAAISVFCVPVYWILGGFYSMNSFDPLVWSLLFYIIVMIIKTNNEKLWIIFGVIAGIGLMNKISVGYLGAGIFVAMIFTEERKWLLNKFFWMGGAIAALIFVPYLIWNMQNEYATLEFIRNASVYKNAIITPIDFFKEQILQDGPLNFFIWFPGIIALLFWGKLKKYRLFAITYILIFAFLSLNRAKPYYLAPVYPVIISAGVVFLTDFFDKKNIRFLKPVAAVLLISGMAVLMPAVVPVLSPAETSVYLRKIGYLPETGENQEIGRLPQYFADRFGWEEMTLKVAGVYNSLSDEEKRHTAIYARNYGEAGAINYYGRRLNLPQALSGHNNHFLWKHEMDSVTSLIIIGGKIENHLEDFEEVTLLGVTENEFSMPYENHLNIFLGRNPKRPLKEIWRSVKKYI